jgi:hypothetical protein
VPRDRFDQAWQASRRTLYLLYPAHQELPALPRTPWKRWPSNTQVTPAKPTPA